MSNIGPASSLLSSQVLSLLFSADDNGGALTAGDCCADSEMRVRFGFGGAPSLSELDLRFETMVDAALTLTIRADETTRS